jgi:hypothetical protein
MPRKSRIDAAGALHHVMVRGIEWRAVFRSDTDRNHFLERLGGIPGYEHLVLCMVVDSQPFSVPSQNRCRDDFHWHAGLSDGVCLVVQSKT